MSPPNTTITLWIGSYEAPMSARGDGAAFGQIAVVVGGLGNADDRTSEAVCSPGCCEVGTCPQPEARIRLMMTINFVSGTIRLAASLYIN